MDSSLDYAEVTAVYYRYDPYHKWTLFDWHPLDTAFGTACEDVFSYSEQMGRYQAQVGYATLKLRYTRWPHVPEPPTSLPRNHKMYQFTTLLQWKQARKENN